MGVNHNLVKFTEFGGAVPYRPAEDLAYSVAKFIQSGGSFINYYMYHGGTNFGRIAGGPFIATSYDYDAPLDEFGFKVPVNDVKVPTIGGWLKGLSEYIQC